METNLQEHEISLKELIQSILRNWMLIVIITAVICCAAIAYVFFIADEVYQSEVEGIITIPESVSTRYGEYFFNIIEPKDYLDLIYSNDLIERTITKLEINKNAGAFKESINVNIEKDSAAFSFIITGPSPEEAMRRMNFLSQNYMEYVSMLFKKDAINFFVQKYRLSTESLNESLSNNMKRLEELETTISGMSPFITLQKLVTSDPEYAAEIARERGINLADMSKEMMLEEVLNTNYLTLQQEIINKRKEISDTNILINQNERYTSELIAESEAMKTYDMTMDDSALNADRLNVIESNIQFISSPSRNEDPIAPRKMMTLGIAGVLGLMLGVFAAFFREYWRTA